MTGLLLLAALAASPLHALARAWLGGWAPDPSAAVLAVALLSAGRTTRTLVIVLLGLGRALVRLEPSLAGELLAVFITATVLEIAAEGLRDVFGRRPWFAVALAAAALWTALLFGLSVFTPLPVTPGPELLLGALAVLPVALLQQRDARRRWA